ncbi:hypothetical protein FB446DRAFT_731954 [Lentinula raphanica]|nr:hypothetical protein FB446DRAFT_731954 [Lentinula raphanica]
MLCALAWRFCGVMSTPSRAINLTYVNITLSIPEVTTFRHSEITVAGNFSNISRGRIQIGKVMPIQIVFLLGKFRKLTIIEADDKTSVYVYCYEAGSLSSISPNYRLSLAYNAI